MSAIILPSFGLAHVRKDEAGNGLSERDISYLRHSGFFLDTCLRQVAVLPQACSPQSQLEGSIEWLTDRAAYSFMLQTATGLNSAISGESNVLGQFKHGWSMFAGGTVSADQLKLAPIMRKLFADSARVRAQHLHGIGGHSYGSLVRKLLKPKSDSKILIIGAGDLSRSVLPYLQNFELGLWNRNRIAADFLNDVRVFAPEDIQTASAWTNSIVITTPADAKNDRRWFELARHQAATIVHLGRRRANPGIWAELPETVHFFDLDDVFGLRNQQSTIRSLRVGYARKACQLHAARLSFEYDVHMSAAVAQRA